MKFPAIGRRSRSGINIPELAGGVNLRDNPAYCNDNQLTELLNMWYKNGALRTRPGTKLTESLSAIGYGKEIKFSQTDISVNGGKLAFYFLSGMRISSSDIALNETFAETHFLLISDSITELPVLQSVTVNFVCLSKGYLYAFSGTERAIYRLKLTIEDGELKYSDSWSRVPETDYYIPLVMTHCKSSHTLSSGAANTVETDGTLLEGYNAIGNYYKMIYSTVNTNASVSSDGYEMAYGIIENTYDEKYAGMYVKANYTDANGAKHYHTVTLQGKPSNWWVWETSTGTDGLIMGVCGRQVRFKVGNVNGDWAKLTANDYVEDNLEITAPYISGNKNKPFSMTRSVWFGGSATGLAGGTRLFLCGSESEEDKALVMWSGLNNPLYFPENAYFYVGDTSSAVTGFGKQSNMLVIFKNNETWYTEYKLNSSITASGLVNGSVTDLQSSAVYFPLTQINPSIGCPYPDTVQLCRNRLVWLGNSKSVYTLLSENQYNERNIYCVSDMLRQRLAEENITAPFSADYSGHYLLFCENNVYAMNYESYGFVYVSSYTKSEDAQKRIPWWCWSIGRSDDSLKALIQSGNGLFAVFYPKNPGGLITDFRVDKMSESFTDDSGEKIKSVMQTKLFDFGAPDFFKSVSSLGLLLGYNGGDEITAELVTDGGTEQMGIFLENGASERSAEFTQTVNLYPNIYSAVRFGIRLECTGNLIVNGLTADYRILGKVR